MALEDRIKEIQDAAERKIERVRADAARKATRDAERRAAREKAEAEARDLRATLEKSHRVTLNPKRDLLWAKSWELGHANGLSEVEDVYDDLVELIK